MLKPLSFILAFVGISFLVLSMYFSYSELSTGVLGNEVVYYSGYVESQDFHGSYSVFYIEDLKFICSCDIFLEGKGVFVKGYVEEYGEIRQIRVLEVRY